MHLTKVDPRAPKDNPDRSRQTKSSPQVAAVSHGAFAGAYMRWLRALRSVGHAGDLMLSVGATLLDAGSVPRRALEPCVPP